MFAKNLMLLGILGTLSCNTFAHSLFLNCEQEENDVKCLGSFSDGSVANNLPIEVISYDDETLLQGKTDDAAQYSYRIGFTSMVAC